MRAARGELELSVWCELSRYLNSENAMELFDACSGKSYELVLELLAARFPRPDLRDSIRRLPVQATDFAPDIECAPGAMTDAASAKPPHARALADTVGVPNSPVISRPATAASAQRASSRFPLIVSECVSQQTRSVHGVEASAKQVPVQRRRRL